MATQKTHATAEQLAQPPQGEDREEEHERVRASNDHDQELERRGERSPHNRGYDEAVSGRTSDSDSVAGIAHVDTDE